MRRGLLATICASLLALFVAPAAQGAFDDPLFVFTPTLGHSSPATPPPGGYFQGPCGLAVDSAGRFYVSDYYHHAIDLYESGANYAGSSLNGSTGYLTQLTGVDPLDGPCALAIDSSGNLYVNDLDRNVVEFSPYPNFSAGPTIAGVGVDSTHPTGVAADPTGGYVYVDDRTSIAAYDSSGTPLGQIGSGTLGDGYGLAVSGYSGTAGYLYAPDASTDTVKVYDPATDIVHPVAQITGPPGGFADLHHSAVAVDDATGEVYVIDTLGAQYSEHPQAAVYVFAPNDFYEGRLKYNVVNGGPSGLAVDNSPTPRQGRVYVSSGISVQASIYAYPPGAATSTALPASFALSTASAGSGAGMVASDLGGIDCTSSCETQIRSGAAVTLSATPGPGSSFAGWSGGGCDGSGDCTVRVDQATSVSAEFEAEGGASPDQGLPDASSSPDSQPAPAIAPHRRASRRHRAGRRRHHARRHRHHRRVRHRHSHRRHRKSR